MELRSLLLSQDQPMIDVVQRALLDLGIGVEVYSTADWAREDLADSKFDAVILDCEVAGAPNLLQMIRGTANNSRTLAFAIVPDDETLQQALASGANLALEKPISVDRARSSLRAAYGLIMQERRRFFRHPLDVAVRVAVSERLQLVGTALNISEGGMAIRCDEELPINAQVKLVLLLPGEKAELEAKGTIVWKDARGHAGVRFEQMSAPNRENLNEWLEGRAAFL